MSYKYAVVWCTKAKSYMKGSQRPRIYHVKMFNSWVKTINFASDFIPPAIVYELIG